MRSDGDGLGDESTDHESTGYRATVEDPERLAANGIGRLRALVAERTEPTALELAEGRAYPTPRARAVISLLETPEAISDVALALVAAEGPTTALMLQARQGCRQVDDLLKTVKREARQLRDATKRAANEKARAQGGPSVTAARPAEPILLDQVGWAGWWARTPTGEWIDVADRTLPTEFGKLWPDLPRTKPGPNGSETELKGHELYALYGHRVDGVVYDATQQSRFVKTEHGGTLYVCPTALDPRLRAEYDAGVAGWLELLGGEEHERLLDWLASAARLDHPIAALYLRGAKSTGKGLLAAAVSRLWGRSISAYSDVVLSNFSEAALNNPVLIADEQVPKDPKDRGSSVFRSITGNREHPLTKKGRPTATIRCCFRVIIPTNSHDALRISGEDLTKEDQEAIAERVLYISVDPASAAYLAGSDTSDWVNDGDAPGRVTRHIAWLIENREVKHPGTRFLVAGHGTAWFRQVGWQGLPATILTAIGYSLSGAERHMPEDDQAVSLVPGGVVVRPARLQEVWKELTRNDRAPTLHALSRALRRLSSDDKPRRVGTKHRMMAWFVERDVILQALEEIGVGDLDMLRNRLGYVLGMAPDDTEG